MRRSSKQASGRVGKRNWQPDVLRPLLIRQTGPGEAAFDACLVSEDNGREASGSASELLCRNGHAFQPGQRVGPEEEACGGDARDETLSEARINRLRESNVD